MNRNVFLLLAIVLFIPKMFAIEAYPFPVIISTPSGEMKVYLRGNEYFKYAVTSDGYPLLHQGNQWFFAQMDDNGRWSASPFLAEIPEQRNDALKTFLESQPKDIPLRPSPRKISTHKRLHQMSHKKAVKGGRRVLVVLMQFTDLKFTKSQQAFDDLFNKKNYTAEGAKGSVYDFYQYVSYQQLDLHCDVIGPFDAQHEMAYYGGNIGWGGNDQNPYALFSEALRKASEVINLADYDTDGDGYIDNLHIIYAGYGEEAGASSDAIWAHEMTFDEIEVSGKKIDRYSCAPELRSSRGGGISRIGPHCHEIGHALGAMDFYDTDYNTGGKYVGTGTWDVMASGSWNEDGVSPANFNPYVKAYDYGWCNVVDITEDGDMTISPSSFDNTIYRIQTHNTGEYFLLENRQQDSFDSSVPGHGLLLFHIGGDIDSKRVRNTINVSYPQQCYIVCASSGYRLPSSNSASYGSVDSDGCPFPGTACKDVFNYYSTPAALCNNGDYARFALSSITENDDKTISFSIEFGKIDESEDEPKAEGEIVWQDTFDNFFLNTFWSQESIEGYNNWSARQSVSANDKQSWIQLSPTFSPFDTKSTRVATRLHSSPISLDEDEYVLSLKMACDNTGNAGTDSVKIIFYSHGDELGGQNYSFPVVSDVWSEHSVLIEKSVLPVEFAIEGICHRKSTLRVDDVTIRRRYQQGASINDMARTDSEYAIYTITGVKVNSSTSFHSGFYIKNGKKFIIK